MQCKLYANALIHALTGKIDLSTDTVKVMLCSGYTPSQGTHDYKNDITNEVTGTGYTAGGATVANKQLTLTGLVAKFTHDPVTWANSTIAATHAVWYVDTGNPATSPVLGYWDFEGAKSSSANNFTLNPAAGGLITFTAS